MRRMLSAVMIMALAACSVTEQAKPDTVQQTGFLKDYSQLQPGAKDQALLVYFNPNARWSRYTKVMIEPVTFWGDASSNVSIEDQQKLSSYYYNKLNEDVSQKFQIVDRAGPGVMTLRVALTDPTAATPVMRSISVVIPQARLLNSVSNLATGSYAFVGSAQSEGEVVDSQTGERLAAAVDKRSGGLSIKNANVWQWGDAENAMDYWAQRTADRLSEFQSGGQI
jgi:Protein of unknown function (DUF3313)